MPFIVTVLGIVFTDLLMGIGMGLAVGVVGTMSLVEPLTSRLSLFTMNQAAMDKLADQYFPPIPVLWTTAAIDTMCSMVYCEHFKY